MPANESTAPDKNIISAALKISLKYPKKFIDKDPINYVQTTYALVNSLTDAWDKYITGLFGGKIPIGKKKGEITICTPKIFSLPEDMPSRAAAMILVANLYLNFVCPLTALWTKIGKFVKECQETPQNKFKKMFAKLSDNDKKQLDAAKKAAELLLKNFNKVFNNPTRVKNIIAYLKVNGFEDAEKIVHDFLMNNKRASQNIMSGLTALLKNV